MINILFLVSSFRKKDFLRIGQKIYKFTNNSMRNRGTYSTAILTNLVRNISTKFEANPSIGSRRNRKW